jgi:hypothetical protein
MKSEESENEEAKAEENGIEAFFFNTPEEWGTLFEEEITDDRTTGE